MRTIDYCRACDMCRHLPEESRDYAEAICRSVQQLQFQTDSDNTSPLRVYAEAITAAMDDLWRETRPATR